MYLDITKRYTRNIRKFIYWLLHYTVDMFSIKNRAEDGVSPVVGVTLLIGVTVILAAVVGGFVLDLGNNVQENPQAGVSFSQDGTNVSVQVVSMENADSLDVRLDETSQGSLGSVGDSLDVVGSSGADITIVGTLDGKDAVLQTYTVE
jgi:archaeal flagellin N-terminal-like domain